MMVPASLFGLFVWTFAAFILILGYIKKKRTSKRVLARWEAEDDAREKQRQLSLILARPDPLP